MGYVGVLVASGFVCLYVTVISLMVVILISSDVPGICSDQPNGILVNNIDSCGSFWRCLDGQPLLEQCEADYNFHEPTQSCVSSDIYMCIDDNDDDDDIDIVSPTPPADSDFPDTGIVPICDGHPNGALINNPLRCRSFYVCTSGVAMNAQCPEGHSFNEAMQSCDNAIDFPCEDDIQTACPDSGIYAFEHPNSCVLFNFCFAGYHSVRECADGLHFNSVQMQCDFPELASCYRELTYACPTMNNPNDIITYASPSRCDEYFICYNGYLWPYRCSPGLNWSQATKECVRPQNSECRPEETPAPLVDCPDEPGLTLVAHPSQCDAYFACSSGIPTLITCLNGFLYDPATAECLPAAQVECIST